MSSNHCDRGAFPALGPLTYLHLDSAEVSAALESEAGPECIWYHATDEASARSAALQGLVPSCWRGGDCCCIFGQDERLENARRPWLLEIRSPALPGQLKAWWVPAYAIQGAWHRGQFISVAELRQGATALADPAGSCECNLAALTREQVARWREAAEPA